MERFLRIAAQILGKSTPARDENKNKTKTHKKKHTGDQTILNQASKLIFSQEQNCP